LAGVEAGSDSGVDKFGGKVKEVEEEVLLSVEELRPM
jgi:hypothetical protein